jgi:ABC-2 type transport system permease protein
MRKRVLAIASALFRNWMRSRSGVFFSFLFPVMLLLLFASIFGW